MKLDENRGLGRYKSKVSDSQLIEQWESLAHLIRQFIYAHTRALPDLKCDYQLGGVPNAPQFLISTRLAKFAFEAFIWEKLSLKIFNPGTQVWAGDLGSTFDTLSENSTREYRPCLSILENNVG